MKSLPKYQLALIGTPLTHSFSKSYFNKKFKNKQIFSFIRYYNLQIDNPNNLSKIFYTFPNLIGFNITMPYKQKIINYLTNIKGFAKKTNSVNTVVITPDNKKIGFNTDYIGLYFSINKLLLKNKCYSALILGTGASAKNTEQVLKYYFKCNNITFASRSPENKNQIPYDNIDLNNYELIINTTPLGMFPNIDEAPPIPYNQIKPNHKFLDLIYNPEKTLFLKKAEKYGAKILNGLPMLITQAEYSWKIWTSYYPLLIM